MADPPYIASLTVYPVKSAGGVSVSHAAVAERGLAFDRRWMVTDASGRQLTGRQFPKLTLVEAALTPRGGLVLRAPGLPDLDVAPAPEGEACLVTVFRQPLVAASVSPRARAWWSEYLGVAVDFVRVLEEASERRMNPRYGTARVAFHDGNPLHLVSLSSVADLNARLPLPVRAERFRANLTVDGAPPFDEDDWCVVDLGEVTVDVVEATARCAMVNITHGQMMPEPLRTLASYRRVGRSVPFGQNATVRGEGGVLRVGEPLTVRERGRDDLRGRAATPKGRQ